MLRVYSETVPFGELTRPETMTLLQRHPVELVLAVRPWEIAELPGVVRRLRDNNVPVSLWPMLSDQDGRWVSVENASAFAKMVADVMRAMDRAKVYPTEVVFDMEPPLSKTAALWRGSFSLSWLRGASGHQMSAASVTLAAVVAELHARKIGTACAVLPLIALDALDALGGTDVPNTPKAPDERSVLVAPNAKEVCNVLQAPSMVEERNVLEPRKRGRGGAWQSLLGTPVDALGVRRVSVMMYTSMLEGASFGAIRRCDSLALLAAATRRTIARWGAASGMSVGCVGSGALMDEPVYVSPLELAKDVALVRGSGCSDISLFDLGGVLRRKPSEAWLDAFALTEASAAVASTTRVRALIALAESMSAHLRWVRTR